ncbi:DUF2892 domain-containing protein [Candidatus Woesearchaeota archaeon]|nr:DUF2892 domain-containing protein [Candidatus Woesearchaeota archaeon]
MDKNVGNADRIIRFVGGIALLAIALLVAENAILKVLLVIFGAIGVIEGIVGWCGLYKMFGINTMRRGRKK